jgi:hypothetical protein
VGCPDTEDDIMAVRKPEPPAPPFDTKELTLVIPTDGGFEELRAIARPQPDGPWLIQPLSGDEVPWKVLVRLHERRSSPLLAFLEVKDATAYLQGRAPWYRDWERLLRPFPGQPEPQDDAETEAFLKFVRCCEPTLDEASAEAWERAHEYGPLRHSLEVFGGYGCEPKKTPADPDPGLFHLVTPNVPAGEGLDFVPLSCRWRGTAKLEDLGMEIWASTAAPGSDPRGTCENLMLNPSSPNIVAYTE